MDGVAAIAVVHIPAVTNRRSLVAAVRCCIVNSHNRPKAVQAVFEVTT